MAELQAQLLAQSAEVAASERRAELAERQKAESQRLLVALQVRLYVTKARCDLQARQTSSTILAGSSYVTCWRPAELLVLASTINIWILTLGFVIVHYAFAVFYFVELYSTLLYSVQAALMQSALASSQAGTPLHSPRGSSRLPHSAPPAAPRPRRQAR